MQQPNRTQRLVGEEDEEVGPITAGDRGVDNCFGPPEKNGEAVGEQPERRQEVGREKVSHSVEGP